MKVLVTGGRDWDDYLTIREALRQAGATCVIHGAAKGADSLAVKAARELGIVDRGYPADWKTHGKAAGPIRNAHMLEVEHRPDEPIGAVFAFPTGASVGTWDMVNKAKRVGLEAQLFRRQRADASHPSHEQGSR